MCESTHKRVCIRVGICINLMNKVEKYKVGYRSLNFRIDQIFPAVLQERI